MKKGVFVSVSVLFFLFVMIAMIMESGDFKDVDAFAGLVILQGFSMQDMFCIIATMLLVLISLILWKNRELFHTSRMRTFGSVSENY